jgi:hypothetical protein
MRRSLDRHVALLVTRKTMTVTIDNTLPLVARVADFLVREAGDAIAGAHRMAVKLGLVELLVNAIEHGNLEIAYAEKMTAPALTGSMSSAPWSMATRASCVAAVFSCAK